MRVVHAGNQYSTWTVSTPVTIPAVKPVAPAAPKSVTVTPTSPTTATPLVATASPAAPTGVWYQYQWRTSTNGGSTWNT